MAESKPSRAFLAAEFTAAGQEVRICTRSPGEPADDLGFHVSRNPSKASFSDDVQWADVVLHNNISLPWAIPLILKRKPWVCANHNWPSDEAGAIDWKGRVKLWASAQASAQISVSKALSAELRGSSINLGNPYQDQLFRPAPGVIRDRDIVFVGRLITGKAVDTLLQAIGRLREDRPAVKLTVVEDGPARGTWRHWRAN